MHRSQRPERRPYFLDQEFWLLQCGKMPAAIQFVEVDQLGEATRGPALRDAACSPGNLLIPGAVGTGVDGIPPCFISCMPAQ